MITFSAPLFLNPPGVITDLDNSNWAKYLFAWFIVFSALMHFLAILTGSLLGIQLS